MSFAPTVTVCVLTYNPQMDKLTDTLDSIVCQKNIALQIVISDDGSKDPCFAEIQNYFKKNNFTNYKLVPAEKNQGTVKNVEKAIRASDGKYIKAISPGDCFAQETTLADWVAFMESGNNRWSFCDAVYYQLNDRNEKIPCSQKAHPQMVSAYKRHNDAQCRWNYIVLEDIVLGAVTLCEKELFLEYIERISGKVVYAEDNAYRIMMFDGITPSYFPSDGILYEYGEGVSTSGSSVWTQRLTHDWDTTTNIMLTDRSSWDQYKEKMARVLTRKKYEGRLREKLASYTIKTKFVYSLKHRFNPRMTSEEVSGIK